MSKLSKWWADILFIITLYLTPALTGVYVAKADNSVLITFVSCGLWQVLLALYVKFKKEEQ